MTDSADGVDPQSKPAWVFGRQAEWTGLVNFVRRTSSRASLAVVSGRRRMGKTYLLRALTEAVNGFYFGAVAATEAESLRQFSAALATHLKAPGAFTFDTWDDAITYLFGAATPERGGRPMVVVIDEFPYLTKVVPELPSLIQREIDRYQTQPSLMRMILCGSAMSVMGGLLRGNAPLRGRAQLELIIQPFPYREAADFWKLTDQPDLALRVNAVLGGTPAYRDQFLADDIPVNLADFDDWVSRTVLSPLSPLFREGRHLLAEEADIRETAVYHSVLAAVAEGNTTRGGIAGFIGRKSVDISHHLNVLEDSHLIIRESDVFRSGRSTYRITEPLITFYESVMRPAWPRLEAGQAAMVWSAARERFAAQILGPHFEAVCRDYVLGPGQDRFGDSLGTVGRGLVTDSAARTQIEIDVAVLEPGSGGRQRRLTLLGEAKWGTTMGVAHLERLSLAREVLARGGMNTRDCAIACFSGAGFTDALRDQASDRVHLITVADLYEP